MNSPDLHPPEWADRFLTWYCRPELLEEIQGDVHELFYLRAASMGLAAARGRFIWDVLRSFRLSTVKHFHPELSTIMFRSHFKIAYRHLLRQKFFSTIKIGGFALGIAACLLIGLFIRDELSYDDHYPEGDRIYRAIMVYDDPEGMIKGVHFPAPFAQVLKADYPEIQQTGRYLASTLFGAGSKQIRRKDQDKNTYEEGFIFADQELLDILGVPFVYGDPAQALAQPHSLVITQNKAEKYFPGENPVGKVMILNNDVSKPFTIGGVIEDFPDQSHIRYDFLMTLAGVEFRPGEQTTWRANNYYTYLKVRADTDVAQLENKLQAITEKYYLPSLLEAGRTNARQAADQMSFELQPLKDIHLRSEGIHDRLHHGDIRLVWMFGAVALFILIIACINFINLSTAKSANRAREVGLRKVLGSLRKHLVNQFLVESMVFSFLAFALGALLARMLLPFFNELSGKELTFPWEEVWFMPLIAAAIFAIGLVAGLYPAFYLSAFKPARVLKGELSRGSKSARLRNGLVIFQFTTSIILIIGTSVIYRQMNYILDKKVGFEKEQVLLLHGVNTLEGKIPTFKKELLSLPSVQNASVSDYLPIEGTKRNNNGFWLEGKVQEDKPVYGQIWRVDHDYVRTLGMQMVEGRDFSLAMPTDSQSVIINQTLVEKMGLDNPIGTRITNSGEIWTVIGVVEDFHFESMKQDIRGICLVIGNSPSMLSVKLNTGDMPAFLNTLSALWDEFAPQQAIRYTFLDESFANMYADVKRTGRIFSSFAILAVVVACLGLFGLAAFLAEQRSKEMSIRKVLGASVRQIFLLLTQNFLMLVGVALLIAGPLGWLLMQRWLEDFEYRIEIGWDVFVIAGVVAVAIALLTISSQAIRAAMANPAEALRNE